MTGEKIRAGRWPSARRAPAPGPPAAACRARPAPPAAARGRPACRGGRAGQGAPVERTTVSRTAGLGVMSSQVVQPGDGWVLPDCRVGPVVVVLVDPCWQSGEPG